MFHPLLQAHLAMADLHCIQGERHLGEQRRNAAELVSGGFQERIAGQRIARCDDAVPLNAVHVSRFAQEGTWVAVDRGATFG